MTSWPALALCGLCLLLDAAYPVCLSLVRRSEVVLPDGRLVSAQEAARVRKAE